MDGEQAVQLTRDIGADFMILTHFESWNHFTEDQEDLAKAFTQKKFLDKVVWTVPEVPKKVY